MKHFLLSVLLVSVSMVSATAQVKMRDVFASAPDSIFPLLTRNNRLDCIDFAENNMQARVKNRFDVVCELKRLTDRYLQFQMSERSQVEMCMLSDSLFCMVNTYRGPASDSRIRFFHTDWTPANVSFPWPSVDKFWTAVPDSIRQDADFVKRSLADLTLISVSVSSEKPELTLTLQIGELEKKEKELAQRYVQPLLFRWNGQAWE